MASLFSIHRFRSPKRGGFLRLLRVVVWLPISLCSLGGQELDLDGDIPFTQGDPVESARAERDAILKAASARRALGVGLYDVAFDLARDAGESLAAGDLWIGNRFVEIDALLAQSRWIEAAERLDGLQGRAEGGAVSRVALRRAMIAFAEIDVDAVKRHLAKVKREALRSGDGAWYWFLRGWVQTNESGLQAGSEAYARARELADEESPALGAQISLLVFRSRLKTRAAGAETIAQLQNAMLENAEREVGYLYAQQLAVALFDNGRVEQAIQLIRSRLEQVPPELPRIRAQFRLLATMAAGLDRLEGGQAFRELIFENRFPELMTIALQQVFSRARVEESADHELLRAVLDELIALGDRHALVDQALYYRAVFRFMEEDYVGAEEDAATLGQRFPGSSYRRGMLALQASSAWNRNRYRTAASYLQQMRDEFADLTVDSRLSALIADCYLRAGLQSNTREDFRNAAEAYANALSNVSNPSDGGPLFFQLIYARLGAGQLEQALASIDNPELRVLAGDEMIWRAEWKAINEMRRVQRVSEAYERVQFAIGGTEESPELHLRMLWLAARLSSVAGEPEDTVEWVEMVDAFAQSEQADQVDADLLGRVRASCLLSLAESRFALIEPEAAVALLERLRQEYAGSEPALFSYIAQARYLSSINRTVEAQQLLVSLADEYRDNRLAPTALFEAALNAEQRGEDAYLDEANKLLQRIVNDYPESEMVYRARLMQADLLRRLNKFDSAERIYYLLENEYADRPDRFLAQLSMADTLIAQADKDPRKFGAAISRLELLMDLPETSSNAPLDLRVEAGFKLGQAWRTRGEVDKAKQVLWSLYDSMVLDDNQLRFLTRNGRYWLSRCLFSLAEIMKEEGEVDKAMDFYQVVIQHRLYGRELARVRLEPLREPLEN
ncbi:hypothetical protein [Pelagicoccus sp. SDUM812003]|uniref:hypothetical protein n=1 Tax=Pelagicoccus sp. SDUM812003 TaxID=3041267 RepID=UPI00280C69D5|nr:hypothetical protein [Pelagicoccus sp. SDUM812003]MDQ8204874.1 hypothetical protein [Pelagicoccus sp. SDUM812003]